MVQRLPSLGLVSSALRVQYLWGIPRSAHYLNRTIDIGHSTVGVEGMDGVVFQREVGLRTSYLEGYVFDQVFGRETGTGISAVRVMQSAFELGQRVFTINSGNADQYLGLVQMSPELREEVINALLIGLDVTIPEFTQNLNGWQGTAYIAIRPETGAGAYIISGNLRGGDEGGDCELQPATQPAQATNFSPAVMFAAGIIALLLILALPKLVGVAIVMAAVIWTQSAAAAPVQQLPSNIAPVWNQVSGGKPWPSQFNWPPPYGTPPLPSGTCTPEQHAALEAAKTAACDDPLAKLKCNGSQSCEEINQKIGAIGRCIDARMAVMEICFLGGDSGHWRQIEAKLGQMNNCVTCRAKREAAQQCSN